MGNKADTSVLAFGNRSQRDKHLAVTRVQTDVVFKDTSSTDPAAAFEDDAGLIIESPAFRRLGEKTMLAPSRSWAFQNRGSHSLVVAQTGVRLAEALHLDSASKTLVNAVALAHDIGHPPFSHEGEEAINARLKEFGLRWDHDLAALDVLLRDTNYGLSYDGLPLTVATVEGVAKRYYQFSKGPDAEAKGKKNWGDLSEEVHEVDRAHPLHLTKWNHVEGQIAAVADWIAGTVTDIQDMMTMLPTKVVPGSSPEHGPADVLANTRNFFEKLREVFPLANDVAEEVINELKEYQQKTQKADRAVLKRTVETRLPAMVNRFCTRLKQLMIEDVVANTQEVLSKYEGEIKHADDVRTLPELMVTPSPELKRQLEQVKDFAQENIYKYILQHHIDTREAVGLVFDDFASGAVRMPGSWGDRYNEIEGKAGNTTEVRKQRALLVAQYITANMSDADVIYHLNTHHKDTWQDTVKRAKPAPYPTMHPPVANYSKKLLVENKLRRLRNTHRLALHMWEQCDTGDFPHFSWKGINETPADAKSSNRIDAQLAEGDISLLSMSLLPSDQSGKSLLPYSMSNGVMPAYLFDLSQDQLNAPRVAKVCPHDLSTGNDVDTKELRLDYHPGIGALDTLYKPFVVDGDEAASKRNMLKALGSEGRRLTEAQLDALGKYYENPALEPSFFADVLPNVVSWNEALVAAAREHIAAIAIPVCVDDRTTEAYMPTLRLAGAIAGLQHLDQGMDLPVVTYRIDAVEEIGSKDRQGDCTFLAQGRTELTRLALNAIGDLQAISMDPASMGEDVQKLATAVKTLLNIDMAVPLSEQSDITSELKNRANKLSSPGESRASR